MMEALIRQMIADSMEMAYGADLVERERALAEIPNTATVLIGMRRTGKTCRMFQRIRELIAAGVDRERILYLNFEDERIGSVDADFPRAVDEAYFRAYPPAAGVTSYYFFDEIQYVSGWERFVRRLLDRRDVRIFLSGSSSKLLSSEVATAMRGRAIETRIHPYSFSEFLTARAIAIPNEPDKTGRQQRAQIEHALIDYLREGGFPAVQGLPEREWRQMLQGYVNTVVLRDIVERHGLTGIAALRYLTRRLMSASASHFSVSKFYNELKSQGMKCGKDTLHDYLQHLEDAFLFSGVFLDTPSERRRMVNPRKMYAADHGLVWACVPPGGNWGMGHALENAVYTELLRRDHAPNYGITRNGYEIDFVVKLRDGRRLAIQVCADPGDPATLAREVRALTDTDPDTTLLLLTSFTEDDIEADGRSIRMVPAWKWFLTPQRGLDAP
ncbi:MAG: ATP-binding protein [Lentisphaeria bacterium]|nr:ATP-binding protein [Lentisphaeria bacterium]